MDFLHFHGRASGSPPPPSPALFLPSRILLPHPASISQNVIQVSTGETLILRPVHKVEILHHGIEITLWNTRTTLRVARCPGPLLPTPAETRQGTESNYQVSPSRLLAARAPSRQGFAAFPRLAQGTPEWVERLRVGWIPVATQTPSGAPWGSEQCSCSRVPAGRPCPEGRVWWIKWLLCFVPLSFFFSWVDMVASLKVRYICDMTPLYINSTLREVCLDSP